MNTTREEDRMILAAIAMHSILCNGTMMDKLNQGADEIRAGVAKASIDQADALIFELEKTRGQ